MRSKPKRRKLKAARRKIRTRSKTRSRKIKARKHKIVVIPRIKKVVNKMFSRSALKKYKALLLKHRENIVGEVEHITNDMLKQSQKDASGDLSGYALHMADMAGDHYDREFSLGIASSEQGVIYEIDEALKRIEDGSYGLCFTCDKPIAKSRLKAVPYAKYCVQCQQKEELTKDQ